MRDLGGNRKGAPRPFRPEMLAGPVRTAARPEELLARLAAGGPALVALSGGVDSAVVAALARRALGLRLLLVTVESRSVSSAEIDAAREVARFLGAPHRLLAAEPLEDERYRANGDDRCYRCRRVETRALRRLGDAEGFVQLLDGIHVDDLGDDRPGIRAMDEAGFLHPLLHAGWRKEDVRRYAREVGLPNADRPSNACLASRVARDQAITAELLGRIDLAERFLLERGFRRVRVRVHGSAARVEVDRAELDRLDAPALRAELTSRLLGLGFASVAIDPRGYPARESLPTVR